MTVKTPPELLDDRDLRHIRRYLKVTSGEIADLAGKDPSAVTHWRKGKKGFPEPVVGGRSPLFRYDEAHDWLKEHNKLAHEPDPAWLWRKSVQALHESTGVEDRSRLRGYVTTMVVVVPDFTDDLDDFVELRETEGFDRWRDETGRDLDTETEKFLGQHINDVKPHGETLKCAARALRYALRKQCTEWELLDCALGALDALSPVQTTTSLPVADLITELIGNLAGQAWTVADLACGEATLITGLLERELLSDARFVGVEKERDTAVIARIRLMLRGSSTTADIQVGDSLAENSTAGPFDIVVIDPPTKKTKAWLDLACKNLATKQTSRAFVLLPRSALVADGPCASLIRERRLEAVVSLPSRLRKDSRGLALCLITGESVRCEETLLIDLADRKVKNPYSGPVTQPPDPSPDALSVRDVCTAISQWRDTRTIDDELLPGCQESIGAETDWERNLIHTGASMRERLPMATKAPATDNTDANSDRPITEEGYPGKRAAEIAGITYRQLDYWARTDLVMPSLARATGSGRLYSYRDLLELRAVKSLLDAGIRLDLVREVFAYLTDQLDEDVTRVNLVISGSSVMVRTGEEEIVDLLRNGQGSVNILPLGGVKDLVDARIGELYPGDAPDQAVLEGHVA